MNDNVWRENQNYAMIINDLLIAFEMLAPARLYCNKGAEPGFSLGCSTFVIMHVQYSLVSTGTFQLAEHIPGYE